MSGNGDIARALAAVFSSPESFDAFESHGPLNVADMLRMIACNQEKIAHAICVPGVPYTDEQDGGKVGDLTEAMIMCGKGLYSIAEAIEGLAEAARDRNEFLREQAEGEP